MRRTSWWRYISSTAMRDYLYGIGSVVDPLPKGGSYKLAYLPDEEAMASDWGAVGTNLRHALWAGADDQHVYVSPHGSGAYIVRTREGRSVEPNAAEYGPERQICDGAD